ncbi:hypothetical protein SNOG_07123 [Parastagonospora nodorum SN15]|uniref:Uncharacterized protein n=1 Tax=Phaeosphaeria nodorum (strain SN15 / ATCC MYA-4574 / FGSC 10173) TaxID=321614 RepID=Q0UM91_PHANO|nr:hypothetical protein SNOG_07123 [Parastagonospora nodorum SN15]EAT85774.1 hypothetical protein SNOG_07123 [Parastagonospora nodorum SN15]
MKTHAIGLLPLAATPLAATKLESWPTVLGSFIPKLLARASRAHCGRAPQKWPVRLPSSAFLLAAVLFTAYQQQGV